MDGMKRHKNLSSDATTLDTHAHTDNTKNNAKEGAKWNPCTHTHTQAQGEWFFFLLTLHVVLVRARVRSTFLPPLPTFV